MKQLFNYYPLREYEAELTNTYGSLSAYLQEVNLDGIELFLPTEFCARLQRNTIGVHLPYLPFWLDLWYGNRERLDSQFVNETERTRYLGGATDRDAWCARVRASVKRAVRYEPQYLVWHVSDANREEIFTRDYYYTDENVIDATAELFDVVADLVPPGVTVLFENLWWQGIRLTDARIVERLFERIGRENVGLMLDTGHLLNTNTRLRGEQEGADYILSVIDGLERLADCIQGIHLQCSLSGAYAESIPPIRPKALSPQQEMAHIAAIDQHRPFQTAAMRRVIERIEPNWLVHELYYDNLTQMKQMLTATEMRLGLL